ncbi:MAG: hypothetical protein HYV99_05925 [Betaproteobacteria bacterium]|nr:hypothetical protein [Betaproteobacteria bacterium]
MHRIQNEAATLELIAAARRGGFQSVNIDLIYGLPKQTLISFDRTLARVIEASPDRVALYNYAHLPTLFRPQRRILERDLPSPETKLGIFGSAVKQIGLAGYA